MPGDLTEGMDTAFRFIGCGVFFFGFIVAIIVMVIIGLIVGQ